MQEKNYSRFMTAEDIMNELSISSSKAYAIIRQLNKELEKEGFLSISGRVSRAYFCRRYNVAEDLPA